jgi:hypothetical protein
MGDLVMFPMTYVSLAKGERTAGVIYANSSGKVVNVIDLPLSWLGTDGTLAVTRLISAGWKETRRGKVKQ